MNNDNWKLKYLKHLTGSVAGLYIITLYPKQAIYLVYGWQCCMALLMAPILWSVMDKKGD